MKIGLLGFEFSSPNKGCEALSYSLLFIFRKIGIKDLTIYNFSAGDLGAIPEYFPEFKFVRIVPVLKDMRFRYIRYLVKCEFIFDVTMGDGFSDIYSLEYYNCLVRQKRIAVLFCKKYILLPQTYGPFKDTNAAESAKKIFIKSYKIYARDVMSQSLLKDNFGIANCLLASDMAFILPYNAKIKCKDDGKPLIKIGLNISGLLYRGGFYKDNQFELALDYKEYIDRLIKWVTSTPELECHLIPHVIDRREDAYDDDYKVSTFIQKRFYNLKIAPPFNTPIEAKSYISNMDIFIGSRMHSTIAAFSSGVVTIPVSYSRKFEGLFNSAGYEFVINGRDENTNSAYNKTIDYINNISILHDRQNDALRKIARITECFIESISKDFGIFDDQITK